MDGIRVSIRKAFRREDEHVVLECMEMTKDFADIRGYVLMKGNVLVGYIRDTAYQLELDHMPSFIFLIGADIFMLLFALFRGTLPHKLFRKELDGELVCLIC